MKVRTRPRFIGPYRVVDALRIGGAVQVYRAFKDEKSVHKIVMLTCLDARVIEDARFTEALLDEARAVAHISDPHLVKVFDVGREDDTCWIGTEYVRGASLGDVMRGTNEAGRSIPPEIACRVISDAAEGLHTAHELRADDGEELGLVHGHVTPDHLFVTHGGSTKVADFGVAKFTSRIPDMPPGRIEGLLAYMSPEQVDGEPIDRRTDVFGLGVVLWELTTGRPLFRGETPLATLRAVEACDVPRPSAVVKGSPPELEAIVMKALAKEPAERFETARAFSRALRSLLMRRGLFVASDEVASWMADLPLGAVP